MEHFHVYFAFFFFIPARPTQKKIHILAWRKTIHNCKNQPHMPDRLETQTSILGDCSWTKVKWQAQTHTAGYILWT